VTLWDGRGYCRKCVDEVSPKLWEFATAGSRLEETVTRGDIRAFRYVLFMGKWWLIAVTLIFGLLSGLLLLAGRADAWVAPLLWAFCAAFGLVFLLLQSVLGVVVFRFRLPRTISVENGELRIVTPKEEKSLPLTACRWYLGSTAVDPLCLFTGLRHGIVIQTPESQLACGHSEEMLGHWRAFLSLTRTPQNTPFGCLKLLGIVGVGMIIGGLLGSGLGYIVSSVMRDARWTPTLGFIAVLDGAFAALINAASTAEGSKAARKRLHPANIGFRFFALGMMIGWTRGLLSGLVCGAINGVFGALLAWFYCAKIRAVEMDRALEAQFRR
jgi:hypothetical protein